MDAPLRGVSRGEGKRQGREKGDKLQHQVLVLDERFPTANSFRVKVDEEAREEWSVGDS